jgi:hypothetical protein
MQVINGFTTVDTRLATSRGSDGGSDGVDFCRRNYHCDYHEMIYTDELPNSGLGASTSGEGGTKMATGFLDSRRKKRKKKKKKKKSAGSLLCRE